MKRISQRQAIAWRNELQALKRRNELCASTWTHDYPGGVHIESVRLDATEVKIIMTARKLGFSIVCGAPRESDSYTQLYAVKP